MNRKVLVLDAEPVVRKLITTIFEQQGDLVTATPDFRVALHICTDDRPDVILTNLVLDGITGHEAMKHFKEICPDVPVLMISGLPQSEVIQGWIGQPGFDVFPKPFTPRDLLAKVDEMLTGTGKVRSASSGSTLPS